jgi:peptidoglycan hydrolase CwlO-like protein
MLRGLAGAVIVAIIAGALFYHYSHTYSDQISAQQTQIAGLKKQLSQLTDQNTQLKTELAKVQAEEANLAAQNAELSKAVASVKATGKLPRHMKLPYPPK